MGIDDERIDFSVLDPKHDPQRFEQMVRVIMDGARSHPLSLELVRWGRTAIAIAAILAVVAWLPSLTRTRSAADLHIKAESTPAELVSIWAEKGSVPSDVDLVQALGGNHDHR